MDYIQRLIFLFLLFSSFSVYSASSFPTLQQAYDACQAYKTAINQNPNFSDWSCIYPAPNNTFSTGGYGLCKPSDTVQCYDYYYSTTPVVCASPQIKSNDTGLCYTPPACEYPETWNEIQQMCATPECSQSYPVWDYVTGQCAVPPVCSAFEQFVNTPDFFGCRINSISCPLHSHANTAMDGCLPDAPLHCDTGFHDDGTYHCVSDDPHACNGDTEVHGYVNGVPQCRKKTDIEDSVRQSDIDASDAQAKDKAADDAEASAQADPTNQAAQDSASQARSQATSAQAQADKSRDLADSVALRSIAENTKQINDRSAARSGLASGTCGTPPVCSGDAIDCAVLMQTYNNNCSEPSAIPSGAIPAPGEVTTTDSAGVSSLSYTVMNGDCPAPVQVSAMGVMIPISYQYLCDYALGIKGAILACCSLAAGYILFASKGV